MNPIRYAVCALALGCLAPAWAINKCTDANGKVSFQDALCAGEGEKIEVRPSTRGATPVPPATAPVAEGAFGPTWQRKNYLQTQGIPQARTAIERNQRDCTAQPNTAATAGPLRRGNLPSGNQFVQEGAEKTADDKAACEARTESLREQLRALEREFADL
ncbi:uncharacterized protein DUF4124 [Acidovorax sp. 69]|uniref:DUF4124 domain-containing protein n=1 Tax=Acidovorax sp. 69 TaxID=2035202 RepID=UPI000C23049D|nr:DUF4124 domain-containing protein [Acidovorax sp. 69]PJI98514.1 uncharacterized protein DUF4124 [Acidovorax sp. 69]